MTGLSDELNLLGLVIFNVSANVYQIINRYLFRCPPIVPRSKLKWFILASVARNVGLSTSLRELRPFKRAHVRLCFR